MAKAIGLGGVFFKSNDAKQLSNWYKAALGIDMQEFGGRFFINAMPKDGYSAFAVFAGDSDYFGQRDQQFMINFVVDDLFATLLRVQRAGGKLIGKPEEYDYGKFGWFSDPDGNKVELWQPIGQ